jgi:carbon-monoxide dehydrogenase small subunit
MIISSYALIKENPHPTKQEITVALDGNLCRCTGYVKIVDAVEKASIEISSKNKKRRSNV